MICLWKNICSLSLSLFSHTKVVHSKPLRCSPPPKKKRKKKKKYFTLSVMCDRHCLLSAFSSPKIKKKIQAGFETTTPAFWGRCYWQLNQQACPVMRGQFHSQGGFFPQKDLANRVHIVVLIVACQGWVLKSIGLKLWCFWSAEWGFMPQSWHLCPWARYFTIIALSFRWDIKP